MLNNKKIIQFKKNLKKEGIDALFTGDPANIKYLTGLGPGWLLFAPQSKPIYFTHPVNIKSNKPPPNLKIILIKNNLWDKVAKEAKKLNFKKIGCNQNKLKVGQFKEIKEKLSLKKIKLINCRPLIEGLRKTKTYQEIKLIKKAAAISQEAFSYLWQIYTQGMTEKDLSIEADRFLRLKADNQTAFPSIVASKKNSVFAHHLPNQTQIDNFFLIDLGAMHCGYCADLTKIFFWGKMPRKLRLIYQTVKKAQNAAIAKIKSGIKAAAVDKVARDVIAKEGLSRYFHHGLGHGIGLEVHEFPYLRPNSNEILKEKMVLTVEPAVYYKNQFGIRLEKMVIVKARGCEVIG